MTAPREQNKKGEAGGGGFRNDGWAWEPCED